MKSGLLLCLLWPAVIFAQPTTATVTGRVRDQAGDVIPGAQVTLISSATGYERVVRTGATGNYTVTALTPGLYTIKVEHLGFRAVMLQNVRLGAGETTSLETTLEVGGLEVVLEIPSTEGFRAQTGALGHFVDSPTIVALPLNGRNFISLAGLAPGVSLPPGSTLPRINGGRPRTNEYLFDGISVLQPEPGQVAFFPVLDAIDSFTIESNSPPAEFGRFNGGVVNVTTKAGSNVLSGTLFGYLRHEALNARNYFASRESSKPMFRRTQVGGVVGGPLVPNRAFFFADYQGQRQSISRTVISTVPTRLQREGIFSEPIGGRVPAIYDPITKQPFGNLIPRERFDPLAASVLARYPLPTSDGTANNFRRAANETNDQDQFDLRADYRWGDWGDSLFGRFSSFNDRFDPVTPLPDGSGLTAGTTGAQKTRSYAWASSYRLWVSDALNNELRAGDTRRAVRRRAARFGENILPTYVIAGYQHLGSPPNTETDFATGVFEVADTLTWVSDRHVIKAGFDVRWSRLNVMQPSSPSGLFQFSSLFTDLPGGAQTGSSLASFLLGQVQSFSLDIQPDQIRNRAHVQEYFVQDDWRVRDRLTVNAGLRYTLNFPSFEAHNRAAVFDLETQQLRYLGRDGNPRTARRLHKNNFGPRFGIASRVASQSLLRAGYALVWIEQAGITTPFTHPSFPFVQTVSQRTLDNVTPAFVLASGPSVAPIAATSTAGLGQGVFAVDRSLGSGYVQQWNVSFQHDMRWHTAIEIAYVGSKITNVGIPDTNLNQLTVDQLRLGPELLRRVPNPFFGTVPSTSTLGDSTITVGQLLKPYPRHTTVSLYRNNVGNTNYHGVTANLGRRSSSSGLAYSIAYTRSRLVDDASSVFDASILTGPVANYPVADSFNRKLERDVSTGDIPHVLVASGVWQIPRSGGVTVSAIATLQSGAPLPVTQVTNFNAFAGFGTQRPNKTGSPDLPASERTPARWFNTHAFTEAPQFTLGNSSRNPVRGPSYRSVDFAIARRTRVAGRVSWEVRAEVFNLLNAPVLGAPNTVVGSPGFGSITSAGDPRVGQLALRLLF